MLVNLFRPINRSCERWTKKNSKQFEKCLISADDCRVSNTQDSYKWALCERNKLIREIISLQINLLHLIVKEKEVEKARFSVWIKLLRNKVLINFYRYLMRLLAMLTFTNWHNHFFMNEILIGWDETRFNKLYYNVICKFNEEGTLKLVYKDTKNNSNLFYKRYK